MKRLLGILIVASVLLFDTSVFGQTHSTNLFEAVPESARARLLERLNLRIEYSRSQQWGKLFDLLYPPRKLENDYLVKKEEYVKRNSDPDDPRQYLLVDFTASNVSEEPLFGAGVYFITGCASYCFRNQTIKEKEIIVAHLIDREWYFSKFGDVAQDSKVCK